MSRMTRALNSSWSTSKNTGARPSRPPSCLEPPSLRCRDRLHSGSVQLVLRSCYQALQLVDTSRQPFCLRQQIRLERPVAFFGFNTVFQSLVERFPDLFVVLESILRDLRECSRLFGAG